jgi:glyoxylase I family protein
MMPGNEQEEPQGGPPFALEGIDHILLLVDGMKAACAFYQEVIGCTFEESLPEFGMAQLRAGESLINLVDISAPEGSWAVPGKAGGRNMDHFCIAIGRHDEAKLRSHLAAHRVEIIEESFHAGARGESLSIYVRDPSGNVIELKGPPG